MKGDTQLSLGRWTEKKSAERSSAFIVCEGMYKDI